MKKILEGKEYATVNTVFDFIDVFQNRVVGYRDSPALITVLTLCSGILNEFLYRKIESETTS